MYHQELTTKAVEEKLGMLGHACVLSTWTMMVGRCWSSQHPLMHLIFGGGEITASLDLEPNMGHLKEGREISYFGR